MEQDLQENRKMGKRREQVGEFSEGCSFKLEGVWKEGRDALSGEEEVRTRSNAEK